MTTAETLAALRDISLALPLNSSTSRALIKLGQLSARLQADDPAAPTPPPVVERSQRGEAVVAAEAVTDE